jgi:hypothetical protein
VRAEIEEVGTWGTSVEIVVVKRGYDVCEYRYCAPGIMHDKRGRWGSERNSNDKHEMRGSSPSSE